MKNILLVEDDTLAIDYLLSQLHPAGYNVITARNEFDALDILSAQSYDIHLILAETDIHSQSVGNEFLRNVKLLSRHASTPFIFLTPKADYEALQRSVALGADDILVKPVDTALLLEKFESLLNGYSTFSRGQQEVDEAAQLDDPIRIISISDLGLTLSMPFEVRKGAKIKVSSGLFKEIGIPSPYLRVIRVYPDPDHTDQFRVEATFLVETRDFASKVKKWILGLPQKIRKISTDTRFSSYNSHSS